MYRFNCSGGMIGKEEKGVKDSLKSSEVDRRIKRRQLLKEKRRDTEKD